MIDEVSSIVTRRLRLIKTQEKIKICSSAIDETSNLKRKEKRRKLNRVTQWRATFKRDQREIFLKSMNFITVATLFTDNSSDVVFWGLMVSPTASLENTMYCFRRDNRNSIPLSRPCQTRATLHALVPVTRFAYPAAMWFPHAYTYTYTHTRFSTRRPRKN